GDGGPKVPGNEVDQDLQRGVQPVQQTLEAGHPAAPVVGGRVEEADGAGSDDGSRRFQVRESPGRKGTNPDGGHPVSSADAAARRRPRALMPARLTVAASGRRSAAEGPLAPSGWPRPEWS